MADSSVTRLPKCNLLDFFKYWLQFCLPLHKLPPKEQELFAHILQKRHEYSKIIMDEALLDKNVLSPEGKREIAERMGKTLAHVRVLFSNITKAKVIDTNGRINPKLIPRLTEGSNEFHLIFKFEIDDTL